MEVEVGTAPFGVYKDCVSGYGCVITANLIKWTKEPYFALFLMTKG